MQISGILGLGGSLTGSIGSGATARTASFADWLASDAKAQREQAIMQERIAAVGLAAYGREQQEMTKLARVLTLVQGEAPAAVRGILDDALADLRDDPAATPTEMADRVATYAAEAAIGAPKGIADQIEGLMERIAELMQQPDNRLAELEGLAWRRKSVARS